MKSNPTDSKAFILLLFSFGSFALTYTTAIVLARALGANGYDDYAVAIASAAILANLAEMGTGKYAMRVFPAYVEQQRWQLAKGYWRFGGFSVLAASAVLALIAAMGETLKDNQFGNYALGIVIIFLPAIALVGVGSELVMANQAPIRAAFVTRLLLPGTTLVVAAAWVASPFDLTAPRATLCYAAGSVAGLVAVYIMIRQTMPNEVRAARPAYETKSWLTSALPFLFFALLISLLSKVGVIVLEMVHAKEAEVAVYAIAAETGTFVYIVAKSTDKLYLPVLSLLIERKDVAEMYRARRHRLAVMIGICVVFLTVVFVFGRAILSVFGDEFTRGYPALCIIAVSTSVWTVFSLAPSYLKYVKKNKFVVGATAISVVANVALCFVLGRRFGATGAAIAYAVPVVILYITFSTVATMSLRKLEQLSDQDISTVTLARKDDDEFSL